MNNTQEITEFDLSLLPGWDEELKCESKHNDADNKTCSGHITHRFTACVGSKLVCRATASYVDSLRKNPAEWCVECRNRVRDDWSVVAV